MGFIGLALLSPYVQSLFNLNTGLCGLTASIMLALMSLPVIVSVSEDAMHAVPDSFREASYALGATKWETTVKVVLPAAAPGILTGIMLSIGRAVGETAAVIFTMGSSLRLPTSLMDSGRTMAVHFYILAREGISMEKAYATALVLVVSILTINIIAYYIMNRVTAKYS